MNFFTDDNISIKTDFIIFKLKKCLRLLPAFSRRHEWINWAQSFGNFTLSFFPLACYRSRALFSFFPPTESLKAIKFGTLQALFENFPSNSWKLLSQVYVGFNRNLSSHFQPPFVHFFFAEIIQKIGFKIVDWLPVHFSSKSMLKGNSSSSTQEVTLPEPQLCFDIVLVTFRHLFSKTRRILNVPSSLTSKFSDMTNFHAHEFSPSPLSYQPWAGPYCSFSQSPNKNLAGTLLLSLD